MIAVVDTIRSHPSSDHRRPLAIRPDEFTGRLPMREGLTRGNSTVSEEPATTNCAPKPNGTRSAITLIHRKRQTASVWHAPCSKNDLGTVSSRSCDRRFWSMRQTTRATGVRRKPRGQRWQKRSCSSIQRQLGHRGRETHRSPIWRIGRELSRSRGSWPMTVSANSNQANSSSIRTDSRFLMRHNGFTGFPPLRRSARAFPYPMFSPASTDSWHGRLAW